MKNYFTNVDLVNDNVYSIQILVKFCPFILSILNKNCIMTPIKGRNYVANLRKMTIYDTFIDLVNDNGYTKCG